MTFALNPRERRGLLLLLVVVAAVRLATLGAYPLLDPTESRYAEIARKMLETGDWLVPQVDYGVPFWGKPPLSTWLSALAMAAFGQTRIECSPRCTARGRHRPGKDPRSSIYATERPRRSRFSRAPA